LTGETPLVVVLGPTAVGKTSLALELAQALNGEIVNADSRQVYRYMNIGTAKPTPAQQTQVTHHLIDIRNPDETISLVEYQVLARAAIDNIFRRGRVPLLVGGTGQYITGLIEGWSAPPVVPNPALRAQLEAFTAQYGAAALHDMLRQRDPEAADSIDYRNVRRVVRALEVCIESGMPFSQQQVRNPPPYRLRQYGLTMNRERLYLRADQRLASMMSQGFLDEVRGLLEMGYNHTLPAMSALGYAQLAQHLTAGVPLEAALTEIKRATRAFIRRQYTWFRQHDAGIIWHDIESLDIGALIRSTTEWLRAAAE